MKLEGCNNLVYKFSKNNKPAIVVENDTVLEIETYDCFENQLRKASDRLEFLDWDKTNPTTGPIFVKGANVGDVLKVSIEKIDVDKQGVIVSGEGFGTLGHLLKDSHTEIIAIENNVAKFMNKFEIPICPMIGVIGVAPSENDVNNGTPGKHGGNMDNTMIKEGAVLYFNVEVEGALFALGDVHAVMGDGEIGVSGLEIPATVRVKLEVLKNKAVEYPMLENEECWSVIVSKETLDEACNVASECMFNFLKTRLNIAEPQIVMLMSLKGDLQICQIVDPLKTVRFVMPKSLIGNLTI